MRQTNRALFCLVTASVLSIGAVTSLQAASTQGAAAGYPGMYPGMMGGRGGMKGMGPGGMMGGSVSELGRR